MLRTRIWSALLLAGIASSGCKGDDKSSAPSAEASEASQKVAEKEQSLLARRDALLSMRKNLDAKRADLNERRDALRASGEDTTQLDDEANELRDEQRALDDEMVTFLDQFASLVSEQQEIKASLTSGDGVAGREAQMAVRERELARREESLAKREATLAQREEELATKWKDGCSVAPQTVYQTIDVKGSKYTKKDVEPLLKQARDQMSKKGVLTSDLPAQVKDLEAEATKAMAEGDYGRARFAASQLLGTVRSMRIDKGFISAKIARLNSRINGVKLSDSDRKRVEGLFQDATANYGDGEYSKANRRLNQIYAALN